MTDDGIGAAIDRLAAVNDIMLEMNGIECLDHTYQTFLDDVQTTEWVGEGGDVSFVWRPWLWQTCTEFGWYQTTNQVALFIYDGIWETSINILPITYIIVKVSIQSITVLEFI